MVLHGLFQFLRSHQRVRHDDIFHGLHVHSARFTNRLAEFIIVQCFHGIVPLPGRLGSACHCHDHALAGRLPVLETGNVRAQLGCGFIHLLQCQRTQRLFRHSVALFRAHEGMAVRHSFHQVGQLIPVTDHIALGRQLFGIRKKCRGVSFHFAGGDAVQSQLANLRDGLFHRLFPPIRFGRHVQTANGTSLTSTIELVEFHKRKGRIVAPPSDIETDLQSCQTHSAR
mmetsp:Transcript_46041/g.96692  ORF Transcript_46041/g.96692 Transcript_46041/m.96692 type:complete len:227 (+) Transcript_46041:981-1661(+)